MTADKTVHGALLLANFIFGFGSIVGALGISPATNPLDFTVVREIIAGTLMLMIAYYAHRDPPNFSSLKILPQRVHWSSFLRLGFFLFVNQAGYILGIKLAGPVMGSIWNPSSPIITVAASILMGLEPFNPRRVAGVLIAFGGCAGMVLWSSHQRSHAHGGTLAVLVGNAALLLHCCATASYVLQSKPILLLYSSIAVTGWSYLLASIFMLVAALLSAMIPSFETLICPTCAARSATTLFSLISIPSASFLALVYFVIFQSVAAWGLVVWSNQYATGTLLLGYTVTQPVTAILFTIFFLTTNLVESCYTEEDKNTLIDEKAICLNPPGLGTFLGMFGVLGGLWMVVDTEPTHHTPPATSDEVKSSKSEDQVQLVEDPVLPVPTTIYYSEYETM